MGTRFAVTMLAITAIAAACTSPLAAETASPAANPEAEGIAALAARATGSTEVGQGARYSAVYLALGRENSKAVKDAEATVKALGIASVPGPLDCDDGAVEALDPGPRDQAVGVYFENAADAEAFADALETKPVGIVDVRTYCAD